MAFDQPSPHCVGGLRSLNLRDDPKPYLDVAESSWPQGNSSLMDAQESSLSDCQAVLMSSLDQLPEELVEFIISDFQRDDLYALRAVCSTLRDKTFACFCRRYFSVVHTDLSKKSTERLQCLADHSIIAPTVQQLHLRPNANDRCNPDKSSGANDKSPRSLVSRCLVGASHQDKVQKLVDILKNKMIRCRSFNLLCFNTLVEYRYDENFLPSDEAIQLISLTAKDVASSQPLDDYFIRPITCCALPQFDFNCLPLAMPYGVEGRAAWTMVANVGLEFKVADDEIDWAVDFIMQPHGLRKLTLGLPPDCDRIPMTPFPRHSFWPLKKLRIAHVNLLFDEFTTVISRCQSVLKSLAIWNVRLDSQEGWLKAFDTLQDTCGELVNFEVAHLSEVRRRKKDARLTWREFFNARDRVLAITAPTIIPPFFEANHWHKEVCIPEMAVDASMSDGDKTFHLWGESGTFGVSYSGNFMKRALTMIASKVSFVE